MDARSWLETHTSIHVYLRGELVAKIHIRPTMPMAPLTGATIEARDERAVRVEQNGASQSLGRFRSSTRALIFARKYADWIIQGEVGSAPDPMLYT